MRGKWGPRVLKSHASLGVLVLVLFCFLGGVINCLQEEADRLADCLV